MHDVEHPGDTGLFDSAEPQCARQDLLQDVWWQGAVRVDERQRHLAVQCGVQGLPELQGRRATVEDQQAVAAAGDTCARYQVGIILGGGRFRAPLTGRVEWNRPTGGLGHLGRNVRLEVVGDGAR